MIKRFASHFIFLPGHGYLKQYVVGVEEGQVVSAFPLTEEIEGVEWFPGVIALLNNEEDISKGYSGIFQKANEVLQELPEVFKRHTTCIIGKCIYHNQQKRNNHKNDRENEIRKCPASA